MTKISNHTPAIRQATSILPPQKKDVGENKSSLELGSHFEIHNSEVRTDSSEKVGVKDASFENRKEFIQDSLLRSHSQRIAQNPEGVREKFDKLAESPFIFFRGTADLFYQELAGKDTHEPKILSNGDVHPENFGVMESPDGTLFFGLNDFDEAQSAPFSWDIKRGVVGFELAARENGFSTKKREAITEKFAEGYTKTLDNVEKNPKKLKHQFTEENSPKLVKELLKKAKKQDRKEFLDKRVELSTGTFRATDEIEPLSERVDEFQTLIDDYRATLGDDAPRKKNFYKVKDVALKTQSGTGSVGLQRYYILVEGHSKKEKDDLILEMKQEEDSVLKNHVPQNSLQLQMTGHMSNGERVVEAYHTQIPNGDRFYGYSELDGDSYLIRERNPHKASVEVATLDADEMQSYARVSGRILAQAHARAVASLGKSGHSIQKKMLKIVEDKDFKKELVSFAQEMGQSVTKDHGLFVELNQKDSSKGLLSS